MALPGITGKRFPASTDAHPCFSPPGVVLVSLLLFILQAQATPRSCEDAWRTSFTNIATRLLASELDVSYGRIQVYPTNEYTPAVHRILQVSANLHDATRQVDPDPAHNLPAVFKPIFLADSQAIFLCGYREVSGDARGLLTPPRALEDPADRDSLQPDDNVLGIPWIIAARRGLPNFNELAVDIIFEISRALEMRKLSANLPPNETNQLFLVSASCAVGVEAWNSHREALGRPVTVITRNRLEVGLQLTNTPSGSGSGHTYRVSNQHVVEVPAWEGTGPGSSPDRTSFLAPIATNVTLLTNGLFRGDGELETSLIPVFDRTHPNTFPVPDISLAFTNCLQFVILDQATGAVLDYVHLKTTGGTNLSHALSDPPDKTGYAGLWATNRRGAEADDIHAPPSGVVNQILIAFGAFGTPWNQWRDYGLDQLAGVNAEKAIDTFRSFLWGNPMRYPPYARNTNLVERVPFTPTQRIRLSQTWQANDPLVHYTAGELAMLALGDGVQSMPPSIPAQTLRNIGRLNDRYEPWGGNPDSSILTGPLARRGYDLRLKDPLVRRADDWNFPAGEPLTPLSLGRLHRGTPWQTLYCKADELSPRDMRSWEEWTGIRNAAQAEPMFPQTDWNLVSRLIQHLWPEKPNKLLSVNEPRRHRWLKALDGIAAPTNTAPDEVWMNYDPAVVPEFKTEVISFKSGQAQQIVEGIEDDRAREPNGYFEEAGDILAVEELSTRSPYLHLSDTQRRDAITDEAYEAIALQLLPKLRSDSVGKWVMKDGRPHLRFSGLEGCHYRIESSTDLIHWKLVRTKKAEHGCVELELSRNCGEPIRYYRSVLQQ